VSIFLYRGCAVKGVHQMPWLVEFSGVSLSGVFTFVRYRCEREKHLRLEGGRLLHWSMMLYGPDPWLLPKAAFYSKECLGIFVSMPMTSPECRVSTPACVSLACIAKGKKATLSERQHLFGERQHFSFLGGGCGAANA